jgi:4-hydroxybenzoate polyprenyltransferase
MPRLPIMPDLSFLTASRWWTYQRERFPLVAHGLLIAAFSASAVSYSALLRGGPPPPSTASFAVAFVSSFLLFLQLRIADEFKDHEDDCAHRPYRPVPRGLIRLRELGVVGVLAAAVQLGLALWFAHGLVWLLLVTWTYLALMTREFFLRDWLTARPVTYLWSHMMIVPLADLYATACDWLRAGPLPPSGLGWFIAMSFTNGVALELGRKIRAPHDEEPGVRTYSFLWGRPKAVGAWAGALVATAGCAGAAAHTIGFLPLVAAALGVLLAVAAGLAQRFLAHPASNRARHIEHFSGLWTLALYLMLGIVPLALRTLGWSP